MLNFRNRFAKTKYNKDFIIAEVKVIVFCTGYSAVGLGATIIYGISSFPVRQIDHELTQYFECERVPHNASSGFNPCDRTGFERLTNPTVQIIAWSLIALYPVTTLIYFLRKRRSQNAKREVMLNNNRSSSKPTNSSSV